MTAVVIGRLRRDLMLLYSGEDEQELQRVAKQAVEEGRAAEVFVLPVIGYFTETSYNWGGIDASMIGATPGISSVPPLNPEIGDGIARPGESLAESDQEMVSIASNILRNAEDIEGPDTGRADAFHTEAGTNRATGPLAGAGHAGGAGTLARGDLTSATTTEAVRRAGPTANVDLEAGRALSDKQVREQLDNAKDNPTAGPAPSDKLAPASSPNERTQLEAKPQTSDGKATTQAKNDGPAAKSGDGKTSK